MAASLLDTIRQRREMLLYGVIGITGVILDFSVFLLLVNAFGVNAALATIVSTLCGITNNFFLNRNINFKKTNYTTDRLIWFFGIGITGAFLSALLLILCSSIFSADPNVIKFLTIPPIVVAQYLLNKGLSFREKPPKLSKLPQVLKNKKALLVINTCFIALCLITAKVVPLIPNSVGAPDEMQHYKNVTFILNEHKLPVSGVDDVESYSNCRDNNYGKVPCLYSYQVNPMANYVMSALSAKVVAPLDVSTLFGARLASIAWGVLFLNVLYLICRLFLSYKRAIALAAIGAFIPQVIFVSSYVNQDIHSLAIASSVVYTSISYLYFKKKSMRWLFYVAIGSLFIAKYNYFIVLLIPVYLMIITNFRKKDFRKTAIDIGLISLFSVVIAGFWYVRNYFLYHDLLGQTFVISEMAKYHTLGRELPIGDISSYLTLLQFDFFNVLFKSFFANFGYLYIQLDESYYTVLKLLLISGLITLFVSTSKKARHIIGLSLLFLALVICQIIANAFVYDYQAQGRYAFAVLPVLVAAIAFAMKDAGGANSKVHRWLLIFGMATISWLLLQSILEYSQGLVLHTL